MFDHIKPKKFHLDPRTKLFLIIVIATLELIDVNIWFTIAVGFIPFILFITNRQYLGSVKYFVLFLLAAFIHVHRVGVQLNMVVNMFVVLLGALVLKLSPAFACADYIIKSTGVSEMISAFNKMKVSRKFLIPLSVMFRFAPTISQERHAIHDAAAMRGIIITRKKFWENPIQAFEYRVVPLMISIANIGEDLSAAALSRGLDNPVRHTNYTDVRFTKKDFFTVLLTVLFLSSVYLISTNLM
ncbi:MAG: energy-coupling factor transporter transmembrane protein EcfT [Lachnospiraceae bacterium]|nr:energy-coupling factor transporter transmembrane protein EcfT [Lachnospiraceae bacterium]